MREVTVRRADIPDAPEIARIHTASWQSAFSAILDSETLARHRDTERIEAMYRRSLENGETGFIAECGQTAGYCFVGRYRDDPSMDLCELICIHVLPSLKHKGIGTALIEASHAYARKEGYRQICLWVFEANTDARAFYEHLGYRKTADAKLFHGAEEIRYIREL